MKCLDAVELDMRGRCSAGQKVDGYRVQLLPPSPGDSGLGVAGRSAGASGDFLSQLRVLGVSRNGAASTLIRRWADRSGRNIVGFTEALSRLVNERKAESDTFQLIVISHDKEFIESLAFKTGTSHYMRSAADPCHLDTLTEFDRVERETSRRCLKQEVSSAQGMQGKRLARVSMRLWQVVARTTAEPRRSGQAAEQRIRDNRRDSGENSPARGGRQGCSKLQASKDKPEIEGEEEEEIEEQRTGSDVGMVGSQRLLEDLESLSSISASSSAGQRFERLSHVPVALPQVVERDGHRDGQRLLVVAQPSVEDREVVEGDRHVGVPLSQHLLPHPQRLLVHLHGPVVLAHVLVQHAEVVEQRCDGRVVGHQRAVVDLQRLLVEVRRLLQVAGELCVGGALRAVVARRHAHLLHLQRVQRHRQRLVEGPEDAQELGEERAGAAGLRVRLVQEQGGDVLLGAGEGNHRLGLENRVELLHQLHHPVRDLGTGWAGRGLNPQAVGEEEPEASRHALERLVTPQPLGEGAVPDVPHQPRAPQQLHHRRAPSPAVHVVEDRRLDVDRTVARARELAPEGVAWQDLLGGPELRRAAGLLGLLGDVLVGEGVDGRVRVSRARRQREVRQHRVDVVEGPRVQLGPSWGLGSAEGDGAVASGDAAVGVEDGVRPDDDVGGVHVEVEDALPVQMLEGPRSLQTDLQDDQLALDAVADRRLLLDVIVSEDKRHARHEEQVRPPRKVHGEDVSVGAALLPRAEADALIAVESGSRYPRWVGERELGENLRAA
eukprot:489746-Hanusia_phi.AAC.6